jgi:hypothetical protein
MTRTFSSWPRLSWRSASCLVGLAEDIDADIRHKTGHDDSEYRS